MGKIEYEDMKNSVVKYGEIYIGRYESSEKILNDNKVVATIKDGETWRVKWSSNMNSKDSEGAVYYSNEMASHYNYPENIKTNLMYGVQYDAIMYFIQNYGDKYDVDNSVNYGNYKNSEIENIYKYWTIENGWQNANNIKKEKGTVYILPTGHTQFTRTNNIYDVAGNMVQHHEYQRQQI